MKASSSSYPGQTSGMLPRCTRRGNRIAAAAAIVLLGFALLWRNPVFPVTLLLPSDLALRGQYLSFETAQSADAQDFGRVPSWSLVAVRQGSMLRGTLVVPGHKLLETAHVEASLENGDIHGVILDESGEQIGRVWGRWGLTGAQGGYELITKETGQWGWSRTPMLQAVPEVQQ
ncbi:hypothetical protein HRbin30_00106 [bacterium HR30]|nr:hypothetical protein HRbin30_00106 [bacterium HR30]